MVNRWDFAAVAFLVIFSTFFINLVVQDAIALVQTLGEPQSQLNFKKATGNVHSPALISFRGFILGGISVPLHYYCSCTLRRVQAKIMSETALEHRTQFIESETISAKSLRHESSSGLL